MMLGQYYCFGVLKLSAGVIYRGNKCVEEKGVPDAGTPFEL